MDRDAATFADHGSPISYHPTTGRPPAHDRKIYLKAQPGDRPHSDSPWSKDPPDPVHSNHVALAYRDDSPDENHRLGRAGYLSAQFQERSWIDQSIDTLPHREFAGVVLAFDALGSAHLAGDPLPFAQFLKLG